MLCYKKPACRRVFYYWYIQKFGCSIRSIAATIGVLTERCLDFLCQYFHERLLLR
jgi:hypothetical protein